MIKDLTDAELHRHTKFAAREEKNATFILLEHLVEIETRRSYLRWPGLWTYIQKELGYSVDQANERNAAVKLLMKVPEAKEQVESGELNLTAAAVLGRKLQEKTEEE